MKVAGRGSCVFRMAPSLTCSSHDRRARPVGRQATQVRLKLTVSPTPPPPPAQQPERLLNDTATSTRASQLSTVTTDNYELTLSTDGLADELKVSLRILPGSDILDAMSLSYEYICIRSEYPSPVAGLEDSWPGTQLDRPTNHLHRGRRWTVPGTSVYMGANTARSSQRDSHLYANQETEQRFPAGFTRWPISY